MLNAAAAGGLAPLLALNLGGPESGALLLALLGFLMRPIN